MRRPEYAARAILRRLSTSNVALLFGSGKNPGFPTNPSAIATGFIRIPTCDTNISMNLGQAVAVCHCMNWSAIRSRAKTPSQLKQATAGELELITMLLLDALQAIGFLDLSRVSDSDERIRRMVRRLRLPERDAVIWIGMLRQMLWKMNQGEQTRNLIWNLTDSLRAAI